MTPEALKTSTRMSRRRLLTVAVATPLLTGLLAACGSRREEEGSSAPVVETVPSLGDAAEVVVRVDQGVGGFTTPEVAFAEIPTFVVRGDGVMVRGGPQIEIYPAPMLPALEAARLTGDQVAALVALAGDSGLLATPPDYESTTPPVADAGATVVTLVADGATYVHRAEALGFDDGTDPARIALAEFVTAASALLDSFALETEIFHPEQYVIGWMEVDPAMESGEIEPTVVPWPETFGAPGQDPVSIDGAVVETALATANQLTFFTLPDGTTARLLLRPVLLTA